VTVWKYYVVKDRDTMKLMYQITVKLDTGDENSCVEMFLNDVIEYTVKIEEVLNKISEFEEQVKKREQELVEKAIRVSKILRILESMGYMMTEEGSISREPIITNTRCSPY